MERFFRSLKTEWIPEMVIAPLTKPKAGLPTIYSGTTAGSDRYTHNDGLPPVVAEQQYWQYLENRGQNDLTTTAGGIDPTSIAAMDGQILGKRLDRPGVAPFGNEHHLGRFDIRNQGQIVMPALAGSFVNGKRRGHRTSRLHPRPVRHTWRKQHTPDARIRP